MRCERMGIRRKGKRCEMRRKMIGRTREKQGEVKKVCKKKRR
jgi:hypothetical protein